MSLQFRFFREQFRFLPFGQQFRAAVEDIREVAVASLAGRAVALEGVLAPQPS